MNAEKENLDQPISCNFQACETGRKQLCKKGEKIKDVLVFPRERSPYIYLKGQTDEKLNFDG